MSISTFDLSWFIMELLNGDHKDLTQLQIAAKLTAMLPDGTSKTTLQNQIVKALKLDEAIIGAQSKKGE